MSSTHNLSIARPTRIAQWIRIYRLYHKAFPLSERKPFSMILKMYRKGKTDVWYCEDNGTFAGLAITINGDDLILLDYFAVAEACRRTGIGSGLLQLLRRQYAGKGLFGEIESSYEETDDQEIRQRRKQFYLRNGMTEMNVMVWLFGVKMELIGFDCRLTYEQYHRFYHDNYGSWAAQNIKEAEYPKEK